MYGNSQIERITNLRNLKNNNDNCNYREFQVIIYIDGDIFAYQHIYLTIEFIVFVRKNY
jgi:hypothetical protein